jgi:hypothetical protein
LPGHSAEPMANAQQRLRQAWERWSSGEGMTP